MTERVGFDEALALVLGTLRALPATTVDLSGAVDRVLAVGLEARVDSPLADTCSRDGFAVRSADCAGASPESPVRLRVVGGVTAGGRERAEVEPGTAASVTTGAVLPPGADAVVAAEDVSTEAGAVVLTWSPRPGDQVQLQGTDVARGAVVARAGDLLGPGRLAFLAAAGHDRVEVVPRPRVGVVATGDEVVPPGRPLRPGQVHASNLVLACSWLRRFRMEAEAEVAPDAPERLRETIAAMLERNDALITAGGAWGSERDLTVRAAADLGGPVLFHRVRMGPGKAAALVMVGGRPVFCLPGGPPSFEAALLHLALPGLLALAGRDPRPFPGLRAALGASLRPNPGWTRFLGCELDETDRGAMVALPRREASRLVPDAFVAVIPPTGAEPGDTVEVLDLRAVIWG